jgi:hypothetical protein
MLYCEQVADNVIRFSNYQIIRIRIVSCNVSRRNAMIASLTAGDVLERFQRRFRSAFPAVV